MRIIEEGSHSLVVAEDGHQLRLMGSIGLLVYVALAAVFGIAGGMAWALGIGALLLAILALILYVHSERWEFDCLSGTVTRARRLLIVVPLRLRRPLTAIRQVTLQERPDSDGDVDRAIILQLGAWETVSITRLGELDSEQVQSLAAKIRTIVPDDIRIEAPGEPQLPDSVATRRSARS